VFNKSMYMGTLYNPSCGLIDYLTEVQLCYK